MISPQTVYWVAKAVGWENLPRRLLQAWRTRTGWLARRLAAERFDEQAYRASLSPGLVGDDGWACRKQLWWAGPGQADLAALTDESVWSEHVAVPAEKLLEGQYPYFSDQTHRQGWPPDFTLDAVNGIQWPVGPHWMAFARSEPPDRDLKLIWEPSRLTPAYHLARQYVRTGDDRWAEAFWTMFDAWVEQNPPQRSAAWACGQEATFRLMAVLFATMATLDSPAAGAERLEAVRKLAWQTGRHLEANINYARSQGNNHAISEAVGMWTIGVLFGELAEAPRWKRHGRAVLAAEIKRQVYDDGSYVQHSLNYHRVMMDDVLWAMALSASSGQPLPAVVKDRFGRAAGWLAEVIDPDSGRVPNYGPNDGANVLPLACADYLDYRPTLQAAWLAIHGKRCLPPGPWDEKPAWLFGPGAVQAQMAPPKREAIFSAEKGGYYVFRGPESWCMTRCHRYRHRPSQPDMLHVDLWYRGENVLRDAGSYRYCCAAPWQHYFLSTAAHNTLEVNGQDQMLKGPRFLWFHWTRGHVRKQMIGPDERVSFWSGQHDGYRRLGGQCVHRRTIGRVDDVYLVVDQLLGTGTWNAALRWRMPPAAEMTHPGRCRIAAGQGTLELAVRGEADLSCQLLAGCEQPEPAGWESLYYNQKRPAPTLVARARLAAGQRVLTVIGPVEAEGQAARLAPDGLAIAAEGLAASEALSALRRATEGLLDWPS